MGMNLYPGKMRRAPLRQRKPLINRKAAFFLGVFVGYMLPLWIKILTK